MNFYVKAFEKKDYMTHLIFETNLDKINFEPKIIIRNGKKSFGKLYLLGIGSQSVTSNLDYTKQEVKIRDEMIRHFAHFNIWIILFYIKDVINWFARL